MKPIIYRIPVRVWVDIRDTDVLTELVDLINLHITGGDDDGVEISVLSRHDHDAPKNLDAPLSGQRHFQVDMQTDGALLRFLVAVQGRPGSELLGYTADELRAAWGDMHKLVTQVSKGGRLSKESLATLHSTALMLDAPSTDVRRCQPIGRDDFILAVVYAEPVEVSA
jgi:hypothetical protein